MSFINYKTILRDRRWLVILGGLVVQGVIIVMAFISLAQPGLPDVTLAPVPGNPAVCRIVSVTPFTDPWVNDIRPGLLVRPTTMDAPTPPFYKPGKLINCKPTGGSVAVQVVNQDSALKLLLRTAPRQLDITNLLISVVLAAIFSLTGITIFLRASSRPVASLAYGLFYLTAITYSLYNVRPYFWVNVLLYALSFITQGMATAFVCLLPHPARENQRRLRLSPYIPLVIGVVLAFVCLLVVWLIPQARAIISVVTMGYTAICMLLIIWVLFWGVRRLLKNEKQIVRVVVIGIVFLLFPMILNQNFWHYTTFVFNSSTHLITIPLMTLPLVCMYALIRHQLLGSTSFISRQLMRGFLWFLVASFFIVPSVILIHTLKSSLDNGGEIQDYVYAILLMLSLLLFPLAWKAVRNMGDQVFYHDFYQYNRSLRDLSTALTRLQHLDQICTFVLPQLVTLLNATGAALVVRTSPTVQRPAPRAWNLYYHADKPFLPQDRLTGVANLALTHFKQPSNEPLLLDGVLLLALYDGAYLSGFLCMGPKLNFEPYSREDASFLATLAAQLSVLEVNSRYLEQAQMTAQQLSALNRRVIYAQEDERRHLALELHDEVLQQAILLVRELSDASTMEEVATSMPLARSIVASLRNTCLQLRPPLLDELGLEEALHWLAHQYKGRDDLHIKVSCVRASDLHLLDEAELALYRVTQEALSNIIKHSGASRVTIRLRYSSSGAVSLLICDNGRGFTRERFGKERLGLVGMHERMIAFGGQLQLRTRPGRGVIIRAVCTSLVARMPVHMQEEALR